MPTTTAFSASLGSVSFQSSKNLAEHYVLLVESFSISTFAITTYAPKATAFFLQFSLHQIFDTGFRYAKTYQPEMSCDST